MQVSRRLLGIEVLPRQRIGGARPPEKPMLYHHLISPDEIGRLRDGIFGASIALSDHHGRHRKAPVREPHPLLEVARLGVAVVERLPDAQLISRLKAHRRSDTLKNHIRQAV